LTGTSDINQDELLMYLSKSSFDSLLEANFKEQGNLSDIIEPISIKVDDLEDYIEGYNNAFDEDASVKVSI